MASEAVELVERTTETTGDCPECDGSAVRDGRETVCEDCGLVLDEDLIDHGPEWRTFDDGDGTRSRVGQATTTTLHDGGLHTEIGRYRDGKGNRLDEEKAKRLNRQRRYHSRARCRSSVERNRKNGFAEIGRMGAALGFSHAEEEQACRLFKQVQEADLLKGHAIEAMAAACLYAVARINGDQFLLDDIVTVARVSNQRVRSAYSVLNADLGVPIPPAEPQQYVGRICSAIDASERVRSRAVAYLDAVSDDARFIGGKPSGVAAACVYVAAVRVEGAEIPTQAEIGDAADVSAVTVRNRRDDVLEVLEDGE